MDGIKLVEPVNKKVIISYVSKNDKYIDAYRKCMDYIFFIDTVDDLVKVNKGEDNIE